MAKLLKLTFDQAIDLVINALNHNGLGKQQRLSVAKALVLAECDGHSGHGLMRVESYVNQIKSNKINTQAKITISSPEQAKILIDADSGFAYPAIDLAIEQLQKKAHQFGLASCSIINSHHCGSLGIQVEKLANHGLIGLMMANTPKAMAPWGAKKAIFGTNPIAFAAPRKNDIPVVIDLSLSKVARGKIVNAEKKGQAIPIGWAIDKFGNPTSDPKEALKGTIAPIGDAKGSALALMVEILVAAHSPTQFSFEASSFFDHQGSSPNVGQFLLAIKPGQINDPNCYFDRLDTLLSTIESLEGARLPGEGRKQKRKIAEQTGLDIDGDLINEIKQMAG